MLNGRTEAFQLNFLHTLSRLRNVQAPSGLNFQCLSGHKRHTHQELIVGPSPCSYDWIYPRNLRKSMRNWSFWLHARCRSWSFERLAGREIRRDPRDLGWFTAFEQFLLFLHSIVWTSRREPAGFTREVRDWAEMGAFVNTIYSVFVWLHIELI